MLNHVVLTGRPVKDPETMNLPSGMLKAEFRLAVPRDTKRDAEGNQETDFLNIVAFDKQAEIVQRYVTKGGLVTVEGRIQERKFAGRDGKDRYVVEIMAGRIHLLETRAQREERELGEAAEEHREAEKTARRDERARQEADRFQDEGGDIFGDS